MLHPKVYDTKNFIESQDFVKEFLRKMVIGSPTPSNGLPVFHQNPYITAMLFHGIAKGSLLVLKQDEENKDEESKEKPRNEQWE